MFLLMGVSQESRPIILIKSLCSVVKAKRIDTFPAAALEFRQLPAPLGFCLLITKLTAMLTKARLQINRSCVFPWCHGVIAVAQRYQSHKPFASACLQMDNSKQMLLRSSCII